MRGWGRRLSSENGDIQERGRPIATHSSSSRFAALEKAKGWPKALVLYSAMHTFGTDLIGATGNRAETSKMMSHSLVALTARYLHPAVAKLGIIMDARKPAGDEARNATRSTKRACNLVCWTRFWTRY